jgi:succinate dehydrogenase/fumarate reductase flavoprotein subunit
MVRYSYPERFNPHDPHLGVSEGEYRLIEAFYDNGWKAIDLFREHGDLNMAEWRMFALDQPCVDYLAHAPENKVPTGRALGPLQQDGKMGLGSELMAQFHAALKRRGVPVLTNHRAARVVLNSDGRVIGLECANGGKTVRMKARKAVIFGTGGYAHNVPLVEAHQGVNLYGACAMPWSTGDFISIAGAAGAQMGDLSTAWRAQCVLEEALQARTLLSGVFFPPGDSMIQVNRHGVRAVNEKRDYNDRTEAHGYYDPTAAEFPNLFMFMIYDQRCAEVYAGDYPFPSKPEGGKNVISGNTLAELSDNISARLAEIADRTGGFSLSEAFSENLAGTVKRFNGFAKAGVDKDFSRGKYDYDRAWQPVFSPVNPNSKWPASTSPNITMHPFSDSGPYHAIILAPGALDTCGGPAIDASARVLDAAGKPMAGLYGAGNCIASPTGEAYYGAGHTLGLATTFGYIAANAAHDETPVNS